MNTTTVVVISPSELLGTVLARALSPERFDVVEVRPGPGVLHVLRRERPRIAVVDRIDERPEAAQLEIALVKELCPDAPIVALSGKSSETDAQVVEQGIFYYMAGPSGGDLVRVIHAAEQVTVARMERGA